MKELIDIFRMTEISAEVRARLIIKYGECFNRRHAMNLTEPLVYELVSILEPENAILKGDRFKSLAGIK